MKSIIERPIDMVVIGTSAGGVDALMKILPAFRKPSHLAVVVVIHLPPKGHNLIPSLLAPDCDFSIKEAESGEKIEKETIYIAPPNYHLCLEPNHTLSLSSESMVNFSRPSIDVMFESAAYAYLKKTLGILLTGANNDGARGLKTISDAGGITIVQDPKDSNHPVMPQAALDLFQPSFQMNLDDIKNLLNEICFKGYRYE